MANNGDKNPRQLAVNGGTVIWLTGLSAAGKSTLANALHNRLAARNVASVVLDGDIMRKGLCADLGFSRQDRRENIRRIGEVAALMANAGLLAITAFISPYAEDRAQARAAAPEGRFMEIYIATPLEICEQRDPKGLYRKARSGQMKCFTGIDDPYEPPKAPDLFLATHEQGVDQCVDSILDWLEAKGLLA